MSQANFELSNQLAEFTRSGVPSLKGFCIANVPDEAYAYLLWAERPENLEEFYDWKSKYCSFIGIVTMIISLQFFDHNGKFHNYQFVITISTNQKTSTAHRLPKWYFFSVQHSMRANTTSHKTSLLDMDCPQRLLELPVVSGLHPTNYFIISAHVHAQTHVHSLVPNSHSPMSQQSDSTGNYQQLPDSRLLHD